MFILNTKSKTFKYYLALLIAIITFLVYTASLQNQFINWDDDLYVYENIHIQSFNADFFRWAFFHFYAGYWIPVTWIFHAIDYAIWGFNPLGHHLSSNILHALNTFLVVLLVARLIEAWLLRVKRSDYSKANNNQKIFFNEPTILITAFVTSALFGLHPLHVESVAWIAEKKDLLCALFFLLSIIAYIKYVSTTQNQTVQKNAIAKVTNKNYLIAFSFFILSLLSKPMSVSIPFVLLILDWYPFERIKSFKNFCTAFVEKLPFFFFSLIFSIITIFAQKEQGAMSLMGKVPFKTRILLSIKTLVVYLWQMAVPLNLVPFYSYPKNVSIFSLQYFFPLILVTGITAVCIIFAKKQKLFLAVWCYYNITLIPVLGIVQVGLQSMADRFTYLPSLSPFLIAALIVAWISQKTDSSKKHVNLIKVCCGAIMISVFILMSYSTYKQIGLWKNSQTLWNFVIEKEPNKFPVAYNNLGVVCEKMGQFDKAVKNYNKAISLEPLLYKTYNNLGVVYQKTGQFDKAIKSYNESISLNHLYFEAYNNLGAAYQQTGEFDKAIKNYNKAISLNPLYYQSYYNKGTLYEQMGKYDKAIQNYNKTITLNPSFCRTYNDMGALARWVCSSKQ